MSKYIALVVTGLFCMLASFSWGRYVDKGPTHLSYGKPVMLHMVDNSDEESHESVGGNPVDRGVMKGLLSEIDKKPAKAKQHMSAAEQAAALKFLWGDGK